MNLDWSCKAHSQYQLIGSTATILNNSWKLPRRVHFKPEHKERCRRSLPLQSKARDIAPFWITEEKQHQHLRNLSSTLVAELVTAPQNLSSVGDYTSLIRKLLSIVFSENYNEKHFNWPGLSEPEFEMFARTLHKVYSHTTRIMRSTPNKSSISRDIWVQQSFLPGHQSGQPFD